MAAIDRLQGRWNESVRNYEEALSLIQPIYLISGSSRSITYICAVLLSWPRCVHRARVGPPG